MAVGEKTESKRNEENVQSEGIVFYPDCGGGHTTVYITEIHQTVNLKLVNFIVCKSHFHKQEKNFS